MTTQPYPHDCDIQAWIDDNMSQAESQKFDAWLAQHPARAAHIWRWREDARQLRQAFSGSLSTELPPRLDPRRLRQQRRRRHGRRLAIAAMLLVSLGLGSFGGWQARGTSQQPAPMADALEAYRLFANAPLARFDVTAANQGEIRRWLEQYFHDHTELPSLAGAGFHAVGGRLLATAQGPAAMILYKNTHGNTISFYIRPARSATQKLTAGLRHEGQLATSYWSTKGYNYALVSHADNTAVRVIQRVAASLKG